MAFVTSNPAIRLDNTPTTAEHPLGLHVQATDNQEYVYVQANGAISQYDVVGIDENYQAAALTKAMADDGWTIGFAQVAFADNDYGFVATRGSNLTVTFAATTAVDTALYTSGTAGRLDDKVTGQTKIDGIVMVDAATGTGSTSEIIATFPRSATF